MKTWRAPWFIISLMAVATVVGFFGWNIIWPFAYMYMLVVISSFIRETKGLQSELEKMKAQSMFDLKTSLCNQSGMETGFLRLYSLLSRQKEPGHFHVMYLDLDHFKTLNDTCGHQAGDKAIVGMSEILQSVFRRRDTILARSSQAGDEFVVILPNATEAAIQSLCQTVATKMNQDERFCISDSQRVTVSVGVSCCMALQDASPRQAVREILEAQLRIAEGEMRRCKTTKGAGR